MNNRWCELKLGWKQLRSTYKTKTWTNLKCPIVPIRQKATIIEQSKTMMDGKGVKFITLSEAVAARETVSMDPSSLPTRPPRDDRIDDLNYVQETGEGPQWKRSNDQYEPSWIECQYPNPRFKERYRSLVRCEYYYYHTYYGGRRDLRET